EVVEQCVEDKEQPAVGDIKELIFDSPLPTYVPVLPPGFEVDSFYVCEECGDRFAVESSFQFHRERRSLLIKYDCPTCQTTITAYNRCNLLAHLRIHGNTSRHALDWNRVFVSPLPFDKMLIGPLFNISEYDETSNAPEIKSRNDSIKQCPECETHLRVELRDHFQGVGYSGPGDPSNKCKYCQMTLATKCSLKAHERYHRQEQPYVCPECAKVFNMWASFCVHLFYCCFHLDKCIRYCCPACNAFLPTTVSLEVHILTLHVKNVFKCNACPIACFSLQTLEEHKIKGHGHTSLPTNAYQQCQLCPDRLIPKARLLFHVIEHVRKPSVCVYGYQCPSCKMFFLKKGEFASHKSQCSEQTSSPADVNNGIVMMKMKNQNDSFLNSNIISGHIPIVASSDITNSHRKDSQVGRTAMKTAACQTKANGNHMAKDVIKNNHLTEKLDSNVENKKADGSVSISYESEKSDSLATSTSVLEIKMEDGMSQCSLNTLNSFNLCNKCGMEIVNNAKISNASDAAALCSNCLKDKPSNKRTRRSNPRSETPLKEAKDAGNNTNKNLKGQSPLKRGKNSIALNGPNKKLRFSAPESTEKDKYKCHICRTLIGTEWDVIQDHFAKEHKNFNLLVLSPRINKIELGDNASVKTSTINVEKKGCTPNTGKKVSESSTEKKGSVAGAEKKGSAVSIEKRGSTSSSEKRGSAVDKKTSAINADRKASNTPVKIKTEPVETKEEEDEPPKNQEARSKRPRRKMPPRGAQNASSTTGNSGQSAVTENSVKNECRFSCFKCKYQSDDVDTFWTHVVTHKTDSRAYQCMECGMCFVVKPSFQKHLFISHKIKDVDKYIKDHELCHQKPKRETRSQSDDPGSPGADDAEDLEENQCRVCKNKFETAVQLNKHFRTHGMAFLLMKQQENRSNK
ncbi:hypothetical protein R5R35_003470, partial [Gryllus longicercus]